MRIHLVAIAAVLVWSSGCARDGGGTPYTVGPNVEVTYADGGASVFETYLCTDPRDVDHLIVGSILEDSDTYTNVFHVSFDRGGTWTQTLTVPHSVDPACAIGTDGIAYAVSVQDSMPSGVSYLNAQRSVDGGRTWVESAVRPNMRTLDRAYVTTGASGHVYVHAYVSYPEADDGTRGPAVAVVYVSSDSGQTFERAGIVPGVAFQAPWFFPANGVTTDDGTFIGLIVELDNTQRNMFLGRSDSASAPHSVNGAVRVIRSRDFGRTLETSPVADAYYDWRVPQLSMASLAVDPSDGPFHGRLYAVWPDARFEWRTQILLSTSDDDGTTWSAPRVVSDTPDPLTLGHDPNDFMPMVAVNRHGVVGVSWHDRRDNPDNLGYWPRFAASLDGGDSWLPSTRVSTSPNALTPDDRHLNGGDTSGLAADADGRFHVTWIDNRTGTAQALAATVDVHGRARQPRR